MTTETSPDQSRHKQIYLHDPADQQNRLELLEYWRSIIKRKVEIISFGFAVALLVAVVVFVMTPIYRSTVTVLIEANKSNVVRIDEVYSGLSANKEYFQTQVEIIKSRDVAVKSIIKAKLWEREEYDPRLKEQSLINKFLVAIGAEDEPVEKDWTEDALADAIYPAFAKAVTVEPVRLSQLIKVSFDSKDSILSARMANVLADVFIENDIDARYQMTQKASSWLQERLAKLQEELADSEMALQKYRDKQGMVDAKDAVQSGVGRQFQEVMSRLVDTRLRLAEAENMYSQIKNAPKSTDLSSLPAVIRNPLVAEAKKQQADVERKLSDTSQRYGAEHPRYLQVEGEVKAARDNLKSTVATVVESVTREYEAARGTVRTLEGLLAAAKGSMQNINRKEFELSVLEREVESNRQMYDMFMKRAKETNMTGDMQSTIARVVDPAVVEAAPVKPKKFQIIVLGLVFGLFLGASASLLLERLDNTLKTSEDVEIKLKQPLLTILPLLGKDEIERTATARIFLDQPQSIYSEAIRTARTGVLLSAIDLSKRILMVTSSVPGEGKTTFSINLAMAHAHTKSTLLIDSDMRRPAVNKGMGLPLGAKGLSNLVAGTANLEECLQCVPGSELMIMPSGTVPPNPLELLLSQKFKDTLAQLSERFDIIIIDTPPVELVSDALVIGSLATGVIYVSKSQQTPIQLIKKGVQRIRRADGQILGVVLNQFDFSKAHRYYGEYSAYSQYGYGGDGYQGGYPSLVDTTEKTTA